MVAGFLSGFGGVRSCVRGKRLVCTRVRAPVDDNHVPEGHRGLHDELYGGNAEKEHGSEVDANGLGFELDGEEIFDVNIALNVVGRKKVAAVYAILDEGREIVYVGITRHLGQHLTAHRAALGPETVRFIQIRTVSFPSRESMESIRNEWIEAIGDVPVGNGIESSKWISSSKQAAGYTMDEQTKQTFEQKKSKLKRAMGEIPTEDLEQSADQRKANLKSAIEEDDWSAEVDAQTKETIAFNSSATESGQVVSPFADAKAGKDPEVSKTTKKMTLESCNEVLDEVRPYLVADGGNVKVLSVEDGNVKVLLEGACGSCPSSTTTMQMGIERVLRENFEDFQSVSAVSDPAEALGDKLSVELCDLVLDQVRPAITGLGGVVKVITAENDTIVLKYTGPEKLAYGIELMLRDKFPEASTISLDG